ncbi:hypothetical protein NLU13_0705 [Sarocladium strictum]|uniref:Uncharacterized protein n=1 Tax=Sarocladium strictum TaxID=5046 RepID=A0AA39LBR9_SARSR|nr:hypothetical protein NLU13_0705 [Sarocladium strictum]
MDRSQIPALQTLNLRPRPLNTHAIAASCDAELAVAAEDCIHVFLPSYPSPGRGGGVPRPQFSLTIRISSKIRPCNDLNRQLFAFQGRKMPSREVPEAIGGVGPVTGRGAGMSQVVRVEWSPSGLGSNLRPVLLALLTTGCVVAFGEDVNQEEEAAELGLTNRSVRMWKILWGLGGMLPIPDPEESKGYRFMGERITSFSWAKEVAPGRALLAYKTEAGDVVIMSVQFGAKSVPAEKGALAEGWEIQEVARFIGSDPHPELDDATDPDFVPSGTSFGVKWSQWVTQGTTRTATLAYMSQNYVGFRRVTITADWVRGEQPHVEVEGSDTISTCLFLSSDAFVEFEDAIWTDENGECSARGYIGTPAELKPFEISLTGPIEAPLEQHSTNECSTSYAPEEEPSNPIAGIVLHPPPSDSKPPLPLYTIARLSATGTNQDWYETNLPHEKPKIPSWAERIRKNTTILVPRATVMGGLEAESDSDDMEDEVEGEEKTEALEHPYRFRIWGIAAFPGNSSTVVVISKHSSLYPHRQGICSVWFGREDVSDAQRAVELTTEGRMWEWMHANGPAVPGVTTQDMIKTEFDDTSSGSELKALFASVLSKQLCVFCDGQLETVGDSAWCENGHSWAACVATGLAIMEPGISRVCAVCGKRHLRRSQLEALAREHLGPAVSVPKAGEACEACGGKFVV